MEKERRKERPAARGGGSGGAASCRQWELDGERESPLLTALEQLAPHDHLCSIYETSEEHVAVGLERWPEYESRLTHVMAQHDCLALCQYDRRLFPPELVLDILRTHPTVLYRGVVCRNMYHVPPDELLGTDRTAREVDRLLTNMRERERAETELRGQREQLAALSRRLIEAQEAERRSIAREIHDDFGQVLTALRLNLQKNGADPGESIELVDQAIGRMRDLALDLRPAILDDLGLATMTSCAALVRSSSRRRGEPNTPTRPTSSTMACSPRRLSAR